MLWKVAALLFATVVAAPAQQSKQEAPPPPAGRDLKIEKDVVPSLVPAKVHIPRSYALVIGIAEYKDVPDKFQLRYAEKDAEAIYSILISPEGGNFRAENVRKLIGPKATLANIRRELEQWLPSAAEDDDRVLVYFAGHGFVAGGKAYLAPYDFDLNRIEKTGYSMDSLGKVFGGKIRAKWKVLLTDSCHSGAIIPEADVRTINRALLDFSRSVFSLTASRDRERSFESPDWGGGHGIFTYYVVKGMEGAADENRDGVVTADELGEYVRRNVREATGGQQNPTADRASFDPDMLLAYVPTNVSAASPPPPKYGTLIVESNMDGVEVFIDGNSAGVVNKDQPLRLPGLVPGLHTLKGVKMGYEPDGPREEMVYPGQEKTVSVKILIVRRRNRSAVEVFEKGVEDYNKGYTDNYRKAAQHFKKALEIDPTYSQAALYLARCHRDLYDQENARVYFRRAVEIDPDYLEARASYAGMLLDIGDVDEAIRQLNVVTQREPDHALAQYLLAQCFRMKDVYDQSIEAARKAIRLTPNNAEAHFWLAESLRMSGHYEEARAEYGEYLRLSDFDSKLAGKLNYYVLGFLIGHGKKKRAATKDVWKDLRSLAYFGLCDCERQLANFDAAIEYCRQSLTYDPEDPYVHYALALSYARHAQATGTIESLPAARKHFASMLRINSEMQEADYARQNIANIDAVLRGQR